MTDLFAQTAPDYIDAHGFRYYREDVHPGPEKADTSGFESFWLNIPANYKNGKDAAERAFGKLKADDKHSAINSVAHYYDHWIKARGKDCGKLRPSTFLNEKRWTDDEFKPQKAPAQGDKMQMYADTIKKGKAFLCKDYSAALARELIDRGYVTEAECKAVKIL